MTLPTRTINNISPLEIENAITNLSGQKPEMGRNVFGRVQAVVSFEDGTQAKGLGGTPFEAIVDLLYEIVNALNTNVKAEAVPAKFSHTSLADWDEEHEV